MLEINTAHCLDVLEGLSQIDSNSVNLIFTSPPYSTVKKTYDGIEPDKYVDWFVPIAKEMHRVLVPNGSFILNINDICYKGERSIYVHELVVALKKIVGFNYFDKMVWLKKNGPPTSGLNRRSDYFEYIFHFSKGLDPIFKVDEARMPYAESSIKRAKSLIKTNVSNKELRQTKQNSYKKWNLNDKGRFPNNVINIRKSNGRNSHVAAFHEDLPAHFIKVHTNEANDVLGLPGDLVVDPFCGSGSTLIAAKKLNRRFIGIDNKQEYVSLSKELLNKV